MSRGIMYLRIRTINNSSPWDNWLKGRSNTIWWAICNHGHSMPVQDFPSNMKRIDHKFKVRWLLPLYASVYQIFDPARSDHNINIIYVCLYNAILISGNSILKLLWKEINIWCWRKPTMHVSVFHKQGWKFASLTYH